jgi:[glutamine synthetase] adenylyltransferase / [glutamine synthetase]-adenylyl-L-tyrosine phosphorylase
MIQTENIENLLNDLPDAESARRFFQQFSEKSVSETKKLLKNRGLLSDVLTLVSFSPLLATTLLQNPQYISWLARQRGDAKIRDKEELLESLARFALTNSQIEAPVLLARFRRRELLRIYLRDIRRLGTIAEITEEISHLADAILEYALRLARQEMDNRYGIPLEIDEKGKAKPAGFCVVALGKLGSNELNYSSDIDLLFLYSAEGTTGGGQNSTRGAVTSREYFTKLSEYIVKLVGGQNAAEGAAYRVDLRLRPHGRVGALAISIRDAVDYYRNSARAWERQTLIRSRAAAGDGEIFRIFFKSIERAVFVTDQSIGAALENVRMSKEKINLEKNSANSSARGYDVKLGRGGIREIEFIAQALQLAYGGRDEWLRAPHTLISLARLADRRLLSETELTELSDAYVFLRRLEHRLQMEHGLQTHLVPVEPEKRLLVARRMNFPDVSLFDDSLDFHTRRVSRIFSRVFESVGEKNAAASFPNGSPGDRNSTAAAAAESDAYRNQTGSVNRQIDRAPTNCRSLPPALVSALEKSDFGPELGDEKIAALERFCEVSPYFAEMLAANPDLIQSLPLVDENPTAEMASNFASILNSAVSNQASFREALAALRLEWTKSFLRIAAFDVFGKIDLSEAKRLQTELAEASLAAALAVTRRELKKHYGLTPRDGEDSQNDDHDLNLAILGLGKLGGRGMDYGSDLDLVLTFAEVPSSKFQVPSSKKAEPQTNAGSQNPQLETWNPELGTFYARAAEIFVTALSSFTREGNLYRVDLRLRPDGKNGAICPPAEAFLSYLENRSAVWEWLAYVKLRGVGGNLALARTVEFEARRIVHERAKKVSVEELKTETRRVREQLERQKTRNSKETNIKFSAGGLLDVYFAMRFLQLRDGVFDDADNRSTLWMLEKLRANDSLDASDFRAFYHGYEFLNRLDHNLRLTVGRTNHLPLANQPALAAIVERMRLDSVKQLLEQLASHRLAVRGAFENVLR